MSEMNIDQTIDLIRKEWHGRTAKVRPWSKRRGSSVLIPLIQKNGEWNLLFGKDGYGKVKTTDQNHRFVLQAFQRR
mgnify:CR=1 FL=1